jgi:hypothetical protein
MCFGKSMKLSLPPLHQSCNDIQKKVLNAAPQLVELGMGVKAKFLMRGEVSTSRYQLQSRIPGLLNSESFARG